MSKSFLFDFEFDSIRLSQAAEQILRWTKEDQHHCRYVVTPNVDHIVKLQTNKQLQAAYRHASMILADGWPLVWASRKFGRPLPERVAGSDLPAALFEHDLTKDRHTKPTQVFLLGAAPGIAAKASKNIQKKWGHIQVCGTYSPPLGFEKDPAENQKIIDRINLLSPDLLILGLGAPKQELWIKEHHQQLDVKVALCLGATIDFMAGHKSRAPRWMQKWGLEWTHRMLSEPKRLAKRYLYDAVQFPRILWREWRKTGRPV
ncbi:MAG: WecB/TagA/CpsF family glycosyltransferase [Pirellulaceae bacterium]|nr:WecB/TagA/CpsF family glycosyltransferase [Pirellulaceae bacterium]